VTQAQQNFKVECDRLRGLILETERDVRGLTPDVSGLPEDVEFQEVNANLMLAVRHLEDARMRLGKAIQWGCEGGVSCYDRKPVRGG
jgi:hypothetical protein